MTAIAAIGLLMMALSLVMIVDPDAWSRGILAFARKPWFHAAEIGSRLLMGALLVGFAGGTAHPRIIAGVGWLFLGAALFLLLAGSARHRAFAERSATFRPIFRPAGCAALVFGAFVVGSAFGWSPV